MRGLASQADMDDQPKRDQIGSNASGLPASLESELVANNSEVETGSASVATRHTSSQVAKRRHSLAQHESAGLREDEGTRPVRDGTPRQEKLLTPYFGRFYL